MPITAAVEERTEKPEKLRPAQSTNGTFPLHLKVRTAPTIYVLVHYNNSVARCARPSSFLAFNSKLMPTRTF